VKMFPNKFGALVSALVLISAIVVKGSTIPQRIADLDTNLVLHSTVTFHPLNHDELEEALRNVYDPYHPHFRKFWSVDQLTARFSATVEQVALVEDFLSDFNISVLSVAKNRHVLEATGTVGAYNAAFQTTIGSYLKPNGNYFHKPDTPLVYPVGMGIATVRGLKNDTRPRRAEVNRRQLSGSLGPSDIKIAYNLGNTYTGLGQHIALVEFDTYLPSDIALYASSFGIAEVNLVNKYVPINGVTLSGASPGSGQEEVTLDIEMINALAPQSTVYVYMAKNTGTASPVLYNQILTDDLVTVVSSSWGSSEYEYDQTDFNSDGVTFQQMALKGMSVFVASGDTGCYGAEYYFSPPPTPQPSITLGPVTVIQPASQAFVTGVGGTTLNYDGSYGGSETGWAFGYVSYDGAYTGGGGGCSVFYSSIPQWQSGFITASPSNDYGCQNTRNVPDVSLDANPATGYAIYINGEEAAAGGTSAATPLWAAFTALANEARTSRGLQSLGFLNPTIYDIAQNATLYPLFFRDITGDINNGKYVTTTGYDAFTGLGTLRGNGFLLYLAGAPTAEAINAANPNNPLAKFFTLPVIIGLSVGGFVVVSLIITAIISPMIRNSPRREPQGLVLAHAPQQHYVTSNGQVVIANPNYHPNHPPPGYHPDGIPVATPVAGYYRQ